MIPDIRKQYNEAFTRQQYEHLLREIHQSHPGSLEFRIAETPVFIPAGFKHQLMEAGAEVLGVLDRPDFKKLTRPAIPKKLAVPGENDHPEFIVLDFAVCDDGQGAPVPRLIELQGFPSMNAFQPLLAGMYRKHFQLPDGFSPYLNGYDDHSYWKLLREIIVGDHDPREVILLEVKPDQQKTRIDFYLTRDKLGIEPVCVTELKREGKELFYRLKGKKTRVGRIYNRIIFDDLLSQKKTLGKSIDLTHRMEVTWASHPNWFYRISKFILPELRSAAVPATYYLNKLEVVPSDLENYVLKPLFSFAGQGVLLEVHQEDLDKIKDPRNWILQKKVVYAPVVETPDGPAKCEIRLMYYWKQGAPAPVLAHNLCRLSKGAMSNVRYHADKQWVGAGICLFEEG